MILIVSVLIVQYAGLNEIVIVDLPIAVDRNSVRVTGGQGLATILEVCCPLIFEFFLKRF